MFMEQMSATGVVWQCFSTAVVCSCLRIFAVVDAAGSCFSLCNVGMFFLLLMLKETKVLKLDENN